MIPAIVSGLLSGVISGMGIGGGTVLIPALSIFLHISQHEAQGVNLLYFIPTALISLWIHIKHKSVKFSVVLPVILSGVVSAACGAYLAGFLEGNLLRRLFGFFLLAMGVYEFFKKGKK